MNLIGIMMSSLFIGCWIVLWDMVTVEVIRWRNILSLCSNNQVFLALSFKLNKVLI